MSLLSAVNTLEISAKGRSGMNMDWDHSLLLVMTFVPSEKGQIDAL